MSLLADVVARLESEQVGFALIGATALAVHGVNRATADVDLLTSDARALHQEMWASLAGEGVSLRILRGDFDDLLAGSIRLEADREVVDVVVGKFLWQAEIVNAASRISIGELSLPVVDPAGLILLKLLAGGPKDAWDIRALLDALESPETVRGAVSAGVSRLPADSRRLWERILTEG